MGREYKNLGTKIDHHKSSKGIVNKLNKKENNSHIEEKTDMLDYNNEPQHIAILSVSSEIKRLFNNYIRK